jgi:hypothetical protein
MFNKQRDITAGGLVGYSSNLRLRIARNTTDAFLHFAAEVSGGSCDPILIHCDRSYDKMFNRKPRAMLNCSSRVAGPRNVSEYGRVGSVRH